MRIKALTTLAAALCLLVQTTAARDYAAEKYHIVGDGTTMNTAAIQQLVDRVSREGGGRIVFGHGRYLTGSIHMRSNVEVHVERGATILGSTSPFDYFNVTAHSGSETDRMDNAHLGLFVSHRARNISFTGEGTIDGQGLALALAADSLHHAGAYVDAHYNTRRMRPSELVRPTLFYLAETDGIRIEQLHLRNSSNWGLSFNMSRNITIRGIDLHNRAYWNNDGIDLTDCQRVTVTGCRINSADDGICLKSYNPDSGNDSIDVSHCEIRSSASAIKFGTGSYGGFRHVSIRHIRVLDTFRSAIAIESVDGAIIEHVSVEDVVATNTGNPIFIRLGQRAGQRPGAIRHIRLKDVFVQVPFGRPDADYDLRGPEVDFFHNAMPSPICGIPGNCIEDVELENIRIVCPGRATKGMAYLPLWRLDSVPERIKDYPEFTMFGELPSWGFYVRHVRGLSLKNVGLSLADADFRPAMVFDDAQDVRLEDIRLPRDGATRQIVYHNCGAQE